MEIRKINRADIPPMVKDKYKEILNAILGLQDTEALEITLPEEKPIYSFKATLYRIGRKAGCKVSITQKTSEGKTRLYVYHKEGG